MVLQCINRRHDIPLGQVIERARRLVEYDKLGIVIEGPRNPDPLPLTARQSNAPLSNNGVVALRQLSHNKPVYLRDPRRPAKTSLIDLVARQTEGDILSNSGIRQVDLLWHVANGLLPCAQIIIRDLDTIRNETPSCRTKQAKNDIRQCRLSGAGRPDDANSLSGPDRQ